MGRAINAPLYGPATPPKYTSKTYAYGHMARPHSTKAAAENAAANVATVKLKSRGTAKPKFQPIEIGGDFVPPHLYAASLRSKNGLIVGSPPSRRFDLWCLALKYHPEYR